MAYLSTVLQALKVLFGINAFAFEILLAVTAIRRTALGNTMQPVCQDYGQIWKHLQNRDASLILEISLLRSDFSRYSTFALLAFSGDMRGAVGEKNRLKAEEA